MSAAGFSAEARNALLEAAETHQAWKVLDVPEIVNSLHRVFGSELDMELARDKATVWDASVNNNLAVLSFCRAHFCPDDDTEFTFDLNTGACAGVRIRDGKLLVFKGDYPSRDSLPEALKTYITEHSN